MIIKYFKKVSSIIIIKFDSFKYEFSIWFNKKNEITGIKNPPNKPVYVLFGLIFVNFGPLKILPNIYPPISVNIHTSITNKEAKKPLFNLK